MHAPNNAKGISWMLISCFWAACMGALVRHMADMGMHAFEVVFYRNFVALILLLPWLMRSGGFKTLKTGKISLYLTRAGVGLIAMYFWFYALINVPLSDATALSFTAPLFTAILATVILKEKGSAHRIMALTLGFIGVIIVLRPGTEMFKFEAMSAVIAALLWAGSGIIIKTLTATDSPRVVVFYMVAMMAPLSLPLALPYLEMPDLETAGWLLALGVTSNLFQISLSNSLSSTYVMVVLPYDFTRLIFVSVIAYFAYDEKLDAWTAVGAAVIMAGAVYASYKEAKLIKGMKESEL